MSRFSKLETNSLIIHASPVAPLFPGRCAWTGIEYLAGRVRPHCDARGAVWGP
jgi:hypothetical protein